MPALVQKTWLTWISCELSMQAQVSRCSSS